MKNILTILLATAFLSTSVIASEKIKNVPEHLENISVTIKASSGYKSGTGSGVLFTRERDDGTKVNFIWTAAHVVDILRSEREVIVNGTKVTVVEFKDAQMVKILTENGRKIGQTSIDARVIRYSDADNGEDLALLMLRAKNYTDVTTRFYCEDGIPKPGTDLYHVGSLRGEMGANSITEGIISRVGRVLLNSEKVFDQTSVTAFPGSSGGGVFLRDSGEYVGMLVRGSGETFNFIVPIRRMKEWATKADVLWALDRKVDLPSYDEIITHPVEDTGFDTKHDENHKDKKLVPKTVEGVEYYPIMNKEIDKVLRPWLYDGKFRTEPRMFWGIETSN
jgi:S1-C subfamily serine protease